MRRKLNIRVSTQNTTKTFLLIILILLLNVNNN